MSWREGALKTEKESTSETPFSCSSLCPRTQTADKAQVTFMPSSLAKRRNEVLRILKGFFCVCVCKSQCYKSKTKSVF